MHATRHTTTSRGPLPRIGALMIAAALIGCTLIGCSSGDAPSAGASEGEPRGELLVFAAASLTDAFGAVANDFEAAHPGVRVKLNFAGSQSLRTQIEHGARAQVFASANAKHMDALRAADLVDEPVVFVHNELVIAVPADNPARIESLADLPNARRLVLAGASVPAGAYAEKVLASAATALGAEFAKRVEDRVVSRETDVRHTLQKVVLGEADAAIVYATDAASAGDKVRAIAIPPEHNVVASYPIATVTGAPRPQLGALFAAFVRSEAGVRRLAGHGFRAPDDAGEPGTRGPGNERR